MLMGVVLLVAFFVLAFVGCLSAYIRLKKQANAALRIAADDFHAAADSLMKTPKELPDEVLRILQHLSHTAFRRGIDRRFLTYLRHDDRKKAFGTTVPSNPIVEQMRPHLRELFSKAVVAWILIIVNRNVLVGRLIRFELQEVSLSAGKVISTEAQKAEVLKIIPKLDGMAA